jgi:hypothetical protein
MDFGRYLRVPPATWRPLAAGQAGSWFERQYREIKFYNTAKNITEKEKNTSLHDLAAV